MFEQPEEFTWVVFAITATYQGTPKGSFASRNGSTEASELSNIGMLWQGCIRGGEASIEQVKRLLVQFGYEPLTVTMRAATYNRKFDTGSTHTQQPLPGYHYQIDEDFDHLVLVNSGPWVSAASTSYVHGYVPFVDREQVALMINLANYKD
jgi:hypothetical protein